jgi:aspartate-semialdehyde dehydrogenase
MSKKIPVAILGATGAVGQRFISLLEDHPWFEVVALTASDRSEGKRYGEAVNWVVPGDIPVNVRDMVIRKSDTGESLGSEARLVFSALPGDAAKEIEPALAAKGYLVNSNASTHRMGEDVALLIPEINPDHVRLVEAQRAKRGWPGLLIAAPNCAVTGIVFPLRALYDAFGLSQVHAVTMQAISGAGYPGVSSFDILDNVIPYIKGEEDKVESEPQKLLGTMGDGRIDYAGFTVSAQVNRVPVMDGHMAALSIKLASKASVEDVKEAIRSWKAPTEVLELPSTPEHPMILRDEPDRPQIRRDRDAGNGMSVTVGRVQECPVLDVKLTVLVHNTLRGAAGGALQNAEWLVASGYVDERVVERAESAAD